MTLEKKKLILVVSLAIVLIVSVLGVSAILIFERPEGEEYKNIAKQLLNEAREEFEKIRGISVREVTLEVVNQSWVAKNWGTPSSSEREEILREENIYKALFLISQDVSLYDTRLDWTELFRAAKWNGKIYVVEENFDVTDSFRAKSTFIHELTHIMQESYSFSTRTTFDGANALTSLKEGDATLMADTFRNEGAVPLLLQATKIVNPPLFNLQQLTLANMIEFDLPDSIDDLNRFPYRSGLEFVKTLYSQEGWSSIDATYSNPPNTTEQIMHPEKYFSGENAIDVEVPSIDGDWNLVSNDCFGESFILIMLDTWIDEDDAKVAAQGWGGDIFNYYEKNDDFLFTWNIEWDTEDDAFEFDQAFREMMYKTSAEKHNCSYWHANGRYISIRWEQNSTIIVSSADESIIQQQILG